MSEKIPVITVDGPSGSGKGTVGQEVAKQLSWHFLDSGAIYRVLAHAAVEKLVDLQDEEGLSKLAGELDVEFAPHEGDLPRVFLDGEDISDHVRSKECGLIASPISAFPKVRQALLEAQYAFRKAPGLVADGRDMGTVVFPDAKLKIFLTADVSVRAQRRYNQLNKQGIDVSLDDVLAALTERDKRDTERVISPLKPADDAVVIDTTRLSIEEVLKQILDLLGPSK